MRAKLIKRTSSSVPVSSLTRSSVGNGRVAVNTNSTKPTNSNMVSKMTT